MRDVCINAINLLFIRDELKEAQIALLKAQTRLAESQIRREEDRRAQEAVEHSKRNKLYDAVLDVLKVEFIIQELQFLFRFFPFPILFFPFSLGFQLFSSFSAEYNLF